MPAAAVAASNRARAGFSLLELLAVLAILAGGATLLLPQVANRQDDLVLRAETKRVGRLVRQAQAEALATHASASVAADPAADTLTVGNEKRVEKLRVDLVSVVPPGDLVFSFDGGPGAQTTFTLADPGGGTATVTVSAGTGHVVYGP